MHYTHQNNPFSYNKYTLVFLLAITHSAKNYKALLGLSIFLITCLLIFANLWDISIGKIGFVDLNPAQLLWYVTFNEWVLLSIPDIQNEIEQDLRSGTLAYLLPRPMSYLLFKFCEASGGLCINLFVLGLAGFVFTWIKAGSFPVNLGGFFLLSLLGFLAGLVGLIFQMVIGLSAFWLHEIGSFYWIWEKLLFVLGGLILPMSFYPEWFQKISYFTPFPMILGERSSLVLNFSSSNAIAIGLLLITWGIIGFALLLFVYQKGLRIVTLEGS